MDYKRVALRNPYICGGWVTGPHFYGRQKLVQEIVSGQFEALYIMGGRRSGKTSLLRRVEEVCFGEERPCLFLDLQTTGRRMDGLFQVLRAELRNKAWQGDHLFSPDLLAAPDLFTLTDELIGRVEVQGVELLLLVDEAEVLLEMARSFPELLPRLWKIWYECPVFKVVVAASRALSNMGQLLRSHGLPQSALSYPFWKGFQLRCLARLDDTAAEALIQQRSSPSPVRVAPHLMQRIREATGCQPYLLQLLCQRLYQPDHSLRPLTESDLEVDELLGSLFRADYQNLLSEERELLWLIADRPREDIGALQMEAGLEDDNLATSLRWLERLGYIQQRREHFSIANRFLASWLLSHREELQEMPVSYIFRF